MQKRTRLTKARRLNTVCGRKLQNSITAGRKSILRRDRNSSLSGSIPSGKNDGMSKKTTKSPSKLQDIFRGSFKNKQERGKFISDRQTLLNHNGYNYLQGIIVQAGPNNDGTFQVQFNSGTTGYSDT